MVARRRRIIIDGDQIQEIEERVIVSAPLTSLADYLVIQSPTTMPVLPYGAVFASYDPDENRGLIVVERPPKRHGLTIHRNASRTVFQIQLPYQYYFFFFRNDVNIEGGTTTRLNFTIDHSMLMWRKDRYTKYEDKFWFAQLPNVQDGRICWGNSRQEGKSLADAMSERVNSFNITEFNGHLGFPTPDYGTNFGRWQEASTDPLVYTKWEFWKRTEVAARTIQDIARHYATMTVPAPLNWDPSFIVEPELPLNFTIGRAREWIDGLSPTLRRRMIAAISDTPTPRGKIAVEPDPNPDNLETPAEFHVEPELDPPAAEILP